MKIAICDDDIEYIENLREKIRHHSEDHEIIEFLSAEFFLKQIYAGEYFDLLFLDVQMPDSDGWEIARELKQTKQKVFIAMVTVHGEHIYDCFGRVDWFAPKPISQEKVWKILDSAQEQLYPIAFEFRTDKMSIALTAPEITYFEVKRNTLLVHSTSRCYEVRLSLKKVKEMILGCQQFVQTHGSFIVNLDHYSGMDRAHVVLKNQEAIKLSRTYRRSFLSALAKYVRGA